MLVNQQISKLAGVGIEKANEIQDVMLSEALLDFSQASTGEYKKAIIMAQYFIENGKRWE